MLTAHFSESELACKCGCGKSDMQPEFMKKLEALRVAYGEPMVITSGFRCNNYNAAVKGSKGSQHLSGNAADVAIAEADKRYRLIYLAMTFGLSIGCDGAFVHVDNRADKKVFFLYPTK